MEKKILVVGSANIDMVVKSERFPEPGETIIGDNFYMMKGGKGANQAVSAARLGGNVNFMCRVGDDNFGRRSIKGYEEEGIRTDYIIIDEGESTGVALISVNGEGENKIVVSPGANNGFTEEEIERAKDIFKDAELVVFQLEIPLHAISQMIKIANENNTKVILNPAPAQSLPDWYYNRLFLVTPNQTEAEQLTGVKIDCNKSALKSAEKFHDWGVENVVITMGSKGAFISSSAYTGLVQSPPVNVEDTTAAGDVFNGALAVALTQDKAWKEAVRFACTAAALSVTKIGAQSSSPKLKELQTFTERLQRA